LNAVALPALICFAISLLCFPLYISWLRRKQLGQYIREEGPQSHAVKAKTPTMGGLCFIVISALVSLAFLFSAPAAAPQAVRANLPPWRGLAVVVIGALCGLVGFADDFSKIMSRSNRGLSARARLIIEFALGLLLAIVLVVLNAAPAHLSLGFVDLPLSGIRLWIYLLAVTPFLVAATTNAVNLHDGMDGLAGGTAVQIFAALAFLLIQSGDVQLAIIAASVVGALAGFLVFNKYPARVFMGDTGSLYLGGLMAAIVASGGLLIWFVPLALIYIAETISVMAQVSYFKLTKQYTPDKPMSTPALAIYKLTHRLPGEGKRLLRMAPLHHHFEAINEERGGKEWHVVAWFWLCQLLLCALTLGAFVATRQAH
jgi:phospho-N-acetylmuramoyl-pentapeptide-transferase